MDNIVEMKQKDLLIFDIDSTLTDSVYLHQKAFQEALVRLGFKDFDDNWSNYEHHTDSFIFKTILEKQTGNKIAASDIEAFEEQLTKILANDTQLNPISEIPGAFAFFQVLNRERFDIVFATGSLLKPALLKLVQSALTIDETLIISSNKLFSREEIVNNAINAAKDHYNTQRYQRVFSFGDGRWDYETAQTLGLIFIGIGNERLLELGAKHHFKDFTDREITTLISNALIPDFPIVATDTISISFTSRGINNFSKAAHFIRHLPYGRNMDKLNLQSVFAEQCGTCSTKHALLYELAKENGYEDIKLFIGLFKMDAVNTASVGGILQMHHIDYIPEAHCYLKIGGEILDVTKPHSKPGDFLPDLLEEIEITSQQITDYKVAYHKNYLESWLYENSHLPFSLNELWQIREACIQQLSSGKM